MNRSIAISALVLSITALPAAAQNDINLGLLEAEITRLAEEADGRVGVAAIHLETGRSVYLNGDEPFPMASTYKVPIAVQLFSRIEAGEISLDTMIEIQPHDLHPGSGTLTSLFDDPGVILSLRNLVELMLLISDNSATDLVLDAAGGADAVTSKMRSLGLDGINVARPTIGLIGDWLGVYDLGPRDEWTREGFGARAEAVSEEDREAAALAFDSDLQDTATPRHMAELLKGIWNRELMSEENSALLVDIMTRSTTGRNRIRGFLPRGTDVAHKTGTIGRTTNDVGIITLPGEAGHVVTVVFIKESTIASSSRETVIAHISRAIYDYFAFNPLGN
ncbi:MAG: class A beta-lactamase [Gemmatimonadota bacterium]|nr:class A beta-lactamase [Gemmatimonadota bacterium]